MHVKNIQQQLHCHRKSGTSHQFVPLCTLSHSLSHSLNDTHNTRKIHSTMNHPPSNDCCYVEEDPLETTIATTTTTTAGSVSAAIGTTVGTGTNHHHTTTSRLILSATATTNATTNTTTIMSDSVVRVIFLLLGVGILIPWNAFVSAKPYFATRLCDENTHDDVVNFEQYFGLVWNVSSVVSLGLVLLGQTLSDWWRRKTVNGDDDQQLVEQQLEEQLNNSNNGQTLPRTHDSTNSPLAGDVATTNRYTGVNGNDGSTGQDNSSNLPISSSSSSSSDRSFYLVMIPLFLYMVFFSIQVVLVITPRIDPHQFLMLTLVGLAICGMCGAIATAGIVATAGSFPTHVGINPFFSGQALGGVVVSIANFVAATAEDPNEYWDQHCTSNVTNNTMMTDMAGTTLIPTQVVEFLAMGNQNNNDECLPYHTIDWAVFSYFMAGCIVLFLCLVGYYHIHTYQTRQHRDEYFMVSQNHHHVFVAPTEQPNTHQLNNNSNNTVSVKDNRFGGNETSPRIGLELQQGRNERRRQNQNGYTNIDSSSSSSSSFDQHRYQPSQISFPPQSAFRTNAPRPCGCTNDQDENGDDNDRNGDGINDPSTNNETMDDVADEYIMGGSDSGAVFSAIKGPVICVYLVFTVTLCLFPSWVSDLRSNHQCERHHHLFFSRLYNDLYVPSSFVLFNVGDLIGRLLSEYVPLDKIRNVSNKLVVAATCRIIFFPLFLMCLTTTTTTTPSANNSTNPYEASYYIVHNDYFSWMVQFMFALTNGILASTAFMYAPRLIVAERTTMNGSSQQERSSNMMTFALCFGLLTGSMLSFPYMEVATRILVGG